MHGTDNERILNQYKNTPTTYTYHCFIYIYIEREGQGAVGEGERGREIETELKENCKKDKEKRGCNVAKRGRERQSWIDKHKPHNEIYLNN